MIDSMSYVVHINNKISSTMWEKYNNGKLKSGTICHWLYTSYCVVSCNNTTSTTIDVSMTGRREGSGMGVVSATSNGRQLRKNK